MDRPDIKTYLIILAFILIFVFLIWYEVHYVTTYDYTQNTTPSRSVQTIQVMEVTDESDQQS